MTARRPTTTHRPRQHGPAAAKVPAARFVCREHGRPVDFRGAGCPHCATERQQAALDRAVRRVTRAVERAVWRQRLYEGR